MKKNILSFIALSGVLLTLVDASDTLEIRLDEPAAAVSPASPNRLSIKVLRKNERDLQKLRRSIVQKRHKKNQLNVDASPVKPSPIKQPKR
jgi:hypothetical protein